MMINTKVLMPIILLNANADMENIPIAIPIDPVIRRGFLPHLSTVSIAITVNTTFTKPIMMV